MTTHKEALTLALEALEKHGDAYLGHSDEYQFAIKKVKEALAEPEQEPEFVTHNVDKPYDWSEWVCPNPSGYLMKCCDCGLVHEAEFGVVRYKSETEREDCDMLDDPNLQAVFRMRRSEKWSPEDTAHRAGGLPMAQPEQEQNLKLMPREATPEMLKAMDECSTEGYDERLYEGHAGSVYMAAWDAFHGQHCYCGDITSLGVIHRDDGPCHYPEHTSEYKRGYADAMNWKMQNHLEHLPAAQPEQEPVTVLPDGSAFAVMSYPLPKDHWLYAERQYECGADEPNELGKPILTHALCDAVVSAVRYAIRGATNCGKENDFDPDALVQNAVYALCGPYGSIQSKEPEQEPNSTTSMSPTSPKALQPEQEPVAHFGSAYVNENGVHVTTVLGPVAIPQDAKLYTTPPQRKPLTDEEIGAILEGVNAYGTRLYTFARAIEAKLKEKNT